MRLHFLMAGHGDCTVIDYGQGSEMARIVIDGGTSSTYDRLAKVLGDSTSKQPVEQLLIVTHVDADHIAGVLSLLSNAEQAQRFGEVLFNGWRHLGPVHKLQAHGARQGNQLSKLIKRHSLGWNLAFGGQAVVRGASAPPPTFSMKFGMDGFVLGPTLPKLLAMRARWEREIIGAGLGTTLTEEFTEPEHKAQHGLQAMGEDEIDVDALADSQFTEDVAPANGSSISVLFVHAGRSVIMAADAHPRDLVEGIRENGGNPEIEVDVFKLPHHGSKNNVSIELVKCVRAKSYVFSSNGDRYEHPDREAVARVIKYGPRGLELIFNIMTKYNRVWDQEHLKTQWGYTTRYGVGTDGVVVDLTG